MALLDIVKKGSTDRSVVVKIIDPSTGNPVTSIVWNSAGIDLWYRREGAARTAITEATLAALTTAHSDGGFLHISDGDYRLDLPDAAFAAGANYVDFGGTVTGGQVIGGRVRLVDIDLEDTVRAGLTALPAAAAAAAGGLFTRGSGAGQINQNANGQVDVRVVGAAADTITASALATDAVTEIVTAIFARTFPAGYGSHTFDEMIKLIVADLVGKLAISGNTVTVRNPGDTADVLVFTTDADGQRSAVTRTP